MAEAFLRIGDWFLPANKAVVGNRVATKGIQAGKMVHQVRKSGRLANAKRLNRKKSAEKKSRALGIR